MKSNKTGKLKFTLMVFVVILSLLNHVSVFSDDLNTLNDKHEPVAQEPEDKVVTSKKDGISISVPMNYDVTYFSKENTYRFSFDEEPIFSLQIIKTETECNALPEFLGNLGYRIGISIPEIIKSEKISDQEFIFYRIISVSGDMGGAYSCDKGVNYFFTFSWAISDKVIPIIKTLSISPQGENSNYVEYMEDINSGVQFINVPFYSQKDPRWICDQIGTCICDFNTCTTETFSTIGDIGCLLTSQSMIFQYYTESSYKNPAELDYCLTTTGGYGNAGICTRGNCATWFNPPAQCKPASVSYAGKSTVLSDLDSDLAAGYPAIALIDNGNHWVVVTGKSGGNYTINDPYYQRSVISPGVIIQFLRYRGPVPNPDTTPPVTTAALDGTVGDAGWYRSGVTVILTASDDRSGVAYTEYNLNGSGWTRYTNPVSVFANGVHNLQYRSVDNRGNVEAIKTIGFQIDTQPPLNPTNVDSGCGAVSGNWQNICPDPSFSWSGAGDATSGVQGYEYYWGIDPMGTVGTYTEQTSYNPPAPGQGERYLRIRTKDIAGNYSNWQTLFRYRYDSEPPTGNLLINNGASLSYTTLVRAGLSANDQMSGVWEYRLRNKNSAWSEWNRFVRECQWVIEEETGANHQVEVQYRDKAGNESATYGSTIYLNLYPSQSSSNKYMLERSTIGTAGVWTSSAKYQLLGTMGQPSMIGEQESSNTISEWGYWTRRTPWVHEVLELFLPMIIN